MRLQSSGLINLDHEGWIGNLLGWWMSRENSFGKCTEAWNIFKEQGEAFGSWTGKGNGPGLWRSSDARGECVFSFVSQGCLVWISYLAMLELSIKPLGCGFLSLIKLFHCIMTPSKISAVTCYGTGSPSLLFWSFIGESSAPHPTWGAALMQLLASDVTL